MYYEQLWYQNKLCRNHDNPTLAGEIYKILIPQEYLLDFEVNHIENKPLEWIIELVQKKDLILIF